MSKHHARRLVLGVTSADSLVLITGLPDRLAQAGWSVHLVADDEQRLQDVANDGVAVHAIAMRREPSPLHDLRSLVSWLRLMYRLRPGVVFVGTPKAGLLGTVAAMITRVPNRIYHLRGLRLETTTGLRRRVFAALERLTMRLSTSVVAVSPSLKRRVVELRLVSERKVVVLGQGSSNGVDLVRFAPGPSDPVLRETLGLQLGVPVVGFVGRVTKDKGGAELASASAQLARRGIEHQLLIVGPVEQDDAMRDFSHRAGARVVCTGRVDDTAPYYRLMSVFCLPTHREGFPNVVLEAAASGVPVVTTDATGAVDSVIADATGYLCRAGDAGSLAHALELALTQHERNAAMIVAARSRVERDFSRANVQEALVRYLRSTDARAGAQRADRPSEGGRQ